jgi:hypothetical protein
LDHQHYQGLDTRSCVLTVSARLLDHPALGGSRNL